MMRRLLLAAGTTLAATAVHGMVLAADTVDRAAVISTYADIAHAIYQDSLTAAEPGAFLITSGFGQMMRFEPRARRRTLIDPPGLGDSGWDNHLWTTAL